MKRCPDTPLVEDLRRSVWEYARRTTEELIDGSSADPRVLGESVVACTNLAELDFADRARRKRLQRLLGGDPLSAERLMATDPANLEYVVGLGDCHNIFGLRLHAVGLARSRALEHFTQARRLYLRAFAAEPRRFNDACAA